MEVEGEISGVHASVFDRHLPSTSFSSPIVIIGAENRNSKTCSTFLALIVREGSEVDTIFSPLFLA